MRYGMPSITTSRPTGSAPPKSFEPSVAPTTATRDRRRWSSLGDGAADAHRAVHQEVE